MTGPTRSTRPDRRHPPRVADLERRLAVPPAAGSFDPATVAGLPAPARRYLEAAIAPGTPLARAARVAMHGHIRLGGRWVPFRGREVVAPHEGFVWSARAAGVIVGSDHWADGDAALHWQLCGLLTLVHADGADVARSAAARAAAEGVWVPTALLPTAGVEWAAAGDDVAVAGFRVGDVQVALHLTVDGCGRLRHLTLGRWGDPDGTGTWDWHPFGLTVTRWAELDGVGVPVAGHVGWAAGGLGEDDAFFRFTVDDLALVVDGAAAA